MSDMTETRQGLDVWMLERRLSRGVAAAGLLGALFLAFRSPERAVPLQAMLAFLGAYGAVKVVVLILGLRAGVGLWPANLAEIGALGVLGYVLWAGLTGWSTTTLVCLIAIVVLLFTGGYFRRRAAAQLLDTQES